MTDLEDLKHCRDELLASENPRRPTWLKAKCLRCLQVEIQAEADKERRCQVQSKVIEPLRFEIWE